MTLQFEKSWNRGGGLASGIPKKRNGFLFRVVSPLRATFVRAFRPIERKGSALRYLSLFRFKKYYTVKFLYNFWRILKKKDSLLILFKKIVMGFLCEPVLKYFLNLLHENFNTISLEKNIKLFSLLLKSHYNKKFKKHQLF